MEISVYNYFLDRNGWHFVICGGIIDLLEESSNKRISAAVRWCSRQNWNNEEICQYLEYLYNEGEL